jgi:hypothetical protein
MLSLEESSDLCEGVATNVWVPQNGREFLDQLTAYQLLEWYCTLYS